jgi:hypothetical protein
MLLIGLQCIMIGALLLFVRRFGAYAETLEKTYQANQDLVAELRQARDPVHISPSQEQSA